MVQFFYVTANENQIRKDLSLSLKQKIQMKNENICALIELYGLKGDVEEWLL